MVRNYPIGLQSFREIRTGKYLYVDKTEIIHRLVETGKYYFLSRPRRFGKSLLVDTIEELFKGSKELFAGLWIYDHWDWTKTNPVIHFNFAELPYKEVGLEEALKIELVRNAKMVGLTLQEKTLQGMFRELIERTAFEIGQVVLLIDEYDKPLIDFLDDTDQLEVNRAVMKSFYSVLKGRDTQIRLLLLTGVSRFSKVSVFSDINHLEDISMGQNFHALVGITQAELEHTFAPEIAAMTKQYPDMLARTKEWYNGYSWGSKDTLYNPFSVLNLMKSQEFMNFWYGTGTPTFLFEQMKKRRLGDVDGSRASANALATFNTDELDMTSLLFQTGYLTIQSELIRNQLYVLGYPNREVKESMLDGLLNTYREPVTPDSLSLVYDMRVALNAGDVPGIIKALDALIGTIPYDYWRADTESIFTIITVLTFKLVGVDIYTEVHSNKGRCDVLVKTGNFIYVIELKLDRTAKEALDQILETNYLQPYQSDQRTKMAIGINFSSKERGVTEYLLETLSY